VSEAIIRRRNSLFGHVTRLAVDTPAHQAWRCHVDMTLGRLPDLSWRRRPDRPSNRWLDQLRGDNSSPADLWRRASIVTWTFGGDGTVLADYALTTTTTNSLQTVLSEYIHNVYFHYFPVILPIWRRLASDYIRIHFCKVDGTRHKFSAQVSGTRKIWYQNGWHTSKVTGTSFWYQKLGRRIWVVCHGPYAEFWFLIISCSFSFLGSSIVERGNLLFDFTLFNLVVVQLIWMFVCLCRSATNISRAFFRSVCKEMCSDSLIPVKAAKLSHCDDDRARERLIWIDCEVSDVLD